LLAQLGAEADAVDASLTGALTAEERVQLHALLLKVFAATRRGQAGS
jgi:hypothetical protein